MQWLVTAAIVVPLFGVLFAGGHEHDQIHVDDTDCAVCLLQQAKWLPESDTPTPAPSSTSEARGITACERIALDCQYLLEPLRGPPTLA